ncbi:hypothetical protein AtubIFM55763_000634 [Aspergillus tubingensis]|uniref:uncharacterized protein n=1 Tax=Aspergillus tubingensis TaxID=5068 RepID=UPI0015784DC2|nr:leucine rich repeat protein [Aspergillus tubingensis]GFN18504.1 leucine rich repeat protein [Aspergillus tubingensis]GLA78743.1 hypothetical protein AtubIFM55763_000634 [Aspergillus tubingensis]GLB00659.1 hypothetical protein AtubIFM57143_009711 [Aspergillus tubingensis]
MGKLNYLGRKIRGIKAGQAVLTSLKKRLPPEDRNKPGNHESALRDPVVEIDITGKELTDVGLNQFIDVLIECIKFEIKEVREGKVHTSRIVKVAELHFQGNQLTVESLAKLAEVVALSKGDLRELDLSKNQLHIETAEDVEKWEAFLGKFKNCYMLKKLDLSGNPLGCLGIEHFARVYLKSDLDWLLSDAPDIIGPDPNAKSDSIDDDLARMKLSDKENEPKGSKKSPDKGKNARPKSHTQIEWAEEAEFTCTRGLRSIPHLILSEIGLSNTSALHLQSMLRAQHTPEHLLKFLPQGKSVTLPQTASLCKSIIWRPTNDLPPYTVRLLEVAESLRDVVSDTEAEGQSINDENDGKEYASRGRNKGQDHDEKPANQVGNDLKTEYARLCKRVQLEAIKIEGVHSSTLWSTALKMMLISRTILLDDDNRPRSDSKVGGTDVENNVRVDEGEKEAESIQGDDSSSDGPNYAHVEFVEPRNRTRVRFVEPNTGAYSYPGEDIAHIGPPVTNTAPEGAGQRAGPSYSRYEAFVSEFPTPQEAYEPSASMNAAVATEVMQIPSAASSSSGTRSRNPDEDRVLRFDVPLKVWRRTIAYVVGANGLLDNEQQNCILKYAASWEALEHAQTFQGAEEHQQIWKLLQTLDCFNYSVWKADRSKVKSIKGK